MRLTNKIPLITLSGLIITQFIFANTAIASTQQAFKVIGIPDTVSSDYPTSVYQEIKPGSSINTNITVANNDSQPVDLQINAVDQIKTAQGDISYKLPSQTQENIGSWVKTSKSNLHLEAGEKMPIQLNISIPAQTTPGDYIGGIALQKSSIQNQGSISTNYRIISPLVRIKITDTPYAAQPTAFFYITVSIFIGCMAYLLLMRINKAKKR